jgi:neutrophil cytosolic factor 2
MVVSPQKLVVASDSSDAFTSFTGATRLQQGISPSGAYVERPADQEVTSSPVVGLGRSATLPSQPGQRSLQPFQGASDEPRLAGGDGTRLPRMKTIGSLPARQGGSPVTERTPNITRSNTTLNTAKPTPNAAVGGPTRGLNVKRPATSPKSPGSAEKERPVLSPVKGMFCNPPLYSRKLTPRLQSKTPAPLLFTTII